MVSIEDGIVLGVDSNGFPILEEESIHFISAKNNKTDSSVTGAKRGTRAGNPWFDPSTGRFANMPAGVGVRSGSEFLKGLVSSSKRYIGIAAKRFAADQISAVRGSNGNIIITLWREGVQLRSFAVPTKDTPADKAKPGADQQVHNRGMSAIPGGVDSLEWKRRMDFVRAAAREFDPQSAEDIREWLKGKTKRELTPHEIDMFLDDVREQRLNDLVDILDNSIRRSIASLTRDRRLVKLVAPRGWRRRTMAGLEDRDIVEVFRRLQSRGFSEEQLQSQVISRFPQERQEKLQSYISDEPRNKNSRSHDIRSDGQQRFRSGKVPGESQGTS